MPTTLPTALRPYLTPVHERLWQEADAFAAEHVAPRVKHMEAMLGKVERKTAELMGARGWFAITVPAAYGGLAKGHVAKTVLIHRIATVSGAAAAILQASQIPVGALVHWGSHEQKRLWLPQVADGTVLPSIAVTEPAMGGQIGGMQAVAERDGDTWVITGSKVHIGNSHLAGVHVVIARTAPLEVPASRALTAFLVERNRRGLTVRPHRPGLGLHGFSCGRLDLTRVRVPVANVLGDVGQGLNVAQSSSILYGRPNLAAVSLGLHEAIVQTTSRYLKHRPRYSGALSDLAVVRDRIGDMEARLRAARILTYQAVHLLDHDLPCDTDLINSKYLGHQWAGRSGRDAMELHGAQALDAGYPMERLWRDIQHTHPPAGTGDFQRIHLAKAALQEDPIEWSVQLAAQTAWSPQDATVA
ncbi:acyl-CoA dehydrogenase [Streptomyces sp. NPDC052036]|uniref:acyl-CoA dehydrogenase family protein n=1 Tax=Streptomyces sp. NPDC052036 TaxID=3155171 RepID=UPI00341EFCD4